jgi:hypothetical protein
MNTLKITTKVGAIMLAVGLSAASATSEPPRVYSGGFHATLKIGGELYEVLPDKFAQQLDPQTIVLEIQDEPVAQPICTVEDNRPLRQVKLSAGFIDIVNHISHAKAIDRVQPGFFDQYVRNLAQVCSGDTNAQPPNIVDPRYWTEDILNDQMSYFNQAVGIIEAINLAHHYLGHYAKYSAKLAEPDGRSIPINNYLTPAEWAAAVKAGVVDSLNCALTCEGAVAFFEAVDRMPRRPAWTAYFVPPQENIIALNKLLERYEQDFFHGRLK